MTHHLLQATPLICLYSPRTSLCKVLLIILRSLDALEFHYHPGFIAINLFLLLSLWLFLSQQVKDYSGALQLSCLADMKSKKDTSLLCYFLNSYPWSNYKKNQTNPNWGVLSLQDTWPVLFNTVSHGTQRLTVTLLYSRDNEGTQQLHARWHIRRSPGTSGKIGMKSGGKLKLFCSMFFTHCGIL